MDMSVLAWKRLEGDTPWLREPGARGVVRQEWQALLDL